MEAEVIANSSDAEDGEIQDDIVEDIYVPLERPPLPNVAISDSGHQSDAEDSDGESTDSDTITRRSSFSKSRKKPLSIPSAPMVSAPKKKRNDIWCTDVQTEVLTNNLVNCNVEQRIDRSRDVESYDFTLATAMYEEKGNSKFESQDRRHGVNWKRKSDGGFVDSHKGKHCEDKKYKSVPGEIGAGRTLLGLSKGVEHSVEELATDIANKLCEEKEELVLRALKIVGKKPVLALFEETRVVEQKGGMMIMNGMRRRTPGGVFFYLLKASEKIPQEKISEVFMDDRKSTAQEKKKTERERRRQRTAKLREAMSKDDFPTLLSRTELAIKQFKARKQDEDGLKVKEEEVEVKNPPPSPATDGRENSSDGEEKTAPGEGRSLTAYADDLFGSEDLMDLA